jgi:hypothetical protein
MKRLISVVRSRLGRLAIAKKSPEEHYSHYLNSLAGDAEEAAYWEDAERHLGNRPRFALIVDGKRCNAIQIRRAIAAIESQWYRRWRCFCVVDELLSKEVQRFDHQSVQVILDDRTSRRQHDARPELTGCDYVVILGGEDVVDRRFLLAMAMAIDEQRDCSLVYCDEDQIDERGQRSAPQFKPDWTPDLLLSTPYVGRAYAVAVSRLTEADWSFEGGWRERCYDWVLRATDAAESVVHVPEVLYSRGRAMLELEQTKDAWAASEQNALQGAVARRQLAADVERGLVPGSWRVRYRIPTSARVTVIVPTGGHTGHLTRLLESIVEKTTWDAYDCLVVDNSLGEDVAIVCDRFDGVGGVRVQRMECRDKPFNYAFLNNRAAEQAQGEYLLFLNDDTEVVSARWMESMLEHALRPEVGIVGAKLVYPDDRIQHAGIVMGIFGCTGHAFKLQADCQASYGDYHNLVRNYSAVTLACAMMRRSTFLQYRLDEVHFPVAFNDVDLCLRMRRDGLLVVYTPYAKLTHFESASRQRVQGPGALRLIRQKWSAEIAYDPYYHPSLTRQAQDFSGPVGWDE